uniref:7TM_GPCR_Srx domain-containing protein n=1 Tax=Caenorhabditis tropicalis TaxID=1561998 RepID=A0A1I7UD74_9PELO
MNHYVAAILLIIVSLGSILPGFPVLILLQSYFPELPELLTVDTIFVYLIQASVIFLLGFLSMCIYSDIACPLAIKGYVYIFSRM